MTMQDAENALATMIQQHCREPRIQSEVERICRALSYSCIREYQTTAGPADLYLPGRRTIIETKATGQVGPEKAGSHPGETQEGQCERYVMAENERERKRLDIDGTAGMPWRAILTDGRLWWIWEWPINQNSELSNKRLLVEPATVPTHSPTEMLNWFRSVTGRSK